MMWANDAQKNDAQKEGRAMSDQSRGTSLRERKKAATRTRLIAVSQRLFAARGYHETTLDEICAEVEVTPQTLLRYFESKAHLAVAPTLDAVDRIIAALGCREGRAVDTWCTMVTDEAADLVDLRRTAYRDFVRNFQRYRLWVDKDPTLVAIGVHGQRRLQDALAAAICADSDGRTSIGPTLLAAALVAGREAVYDLWYSGRIDDELLVAEQRRTIDDVLDKGKTWLTN